MGLYDDMAADAADILAEAGRTITFRSTDTQVMIGEQALGFDLERGGMVATGALTVKFLRATFVSNPPKDGEHLTYAGVEYHINSVTHRPPSAWFICACDPV